MDMAPSTKPSNLALLEEYKLCHSLVYHLNSINATYESVFLAGSLAATGFVLQNPTVLRLSAVTAVSAVVLVGLLFLIRRGKKIQGECYDRMTDIENVLHLGIQHRLNDKRKGFSQLKIFTIIIVIYLALLTTFTIAKYLGFGYLMTLVRIVLHV